MVENNVVMYIYDNPLQPRDILPGVGRSTVSPLHQVQPPLGSRLLGVREYSTIRERLPCVLACVFGLFDSFETSCPRIKPPDVCARQHAWILYFVYSFRSRYTASRRFCRQTCVHGRHCEILLVIY